MDTAIENKQTEESANGAQSVVTEPENVRLPRPTLLAALEKNGRARWWRRCGNQKEGFTYEDSRGRPITDARHLERIAHLAIPPGYQEVRVAPSATSRLQVIAIDAADRLQYRYHADHTAQQAAKKYAKIERFGELLPRLRRVTNQHIAEQGLSRERILAVVVRLINDLYFRLGSEASVERYRTFGVTTLRNRHLTIESDGTLLFQFVGKHHIAQRRLLVDPDLAALMREIKALRGPALFHYLDGGGKPHAITPADVNHYIKAAVGPEFSAKDFRTWGGTLLAAVALADIGRVESDTITSDSSMLPEETTPALHGSPNGNGSDAKPKLTRAQRQVQHNIVEATKQVAERLGNTPTVCRECYIHPIVFERYAQGVTLDDFRPHTRRHIERHQPDYHPEERALLKLFRASETP